MMCDVFFLQILPKLHFISTPSSEVPVGRGFEPWLVLEIFSCFPASRWWVRSSPSPYFFCNTSVAENIPVLSERLVQLVKLSQNINCIQ